MRELVFILEEKSARAMIEVILPRIVPEELNITPKYIVFQGKQDLENEITRKLKGYNNPDSRFIILRDQDAGERLAIANRSPLLDLKS